MALDQSALLELPDVLRAPVAPTGVVRCAVGGAVAGGDKRGRVELEAWSGDHAAIRAILQSNPDT